MSEYLLGLQCGECDAGEYSDDLIVDPLCPRHGGAQIAKFDLARMRNEVDRDRIAAAPRGIWRWSCLLPLRDPANIVTLYEGDTPLYHARRLGEELGLSHLYIKDDSVNPTGSFKDRGASVTLSKCKETGAPGVILASSGNAATSFAAYAARAGVPFYAFMLDQTSDVHLLQAMSYGNPVFIIEGDVTHAGRLATQVAAERGLFHGVQPDNLYRAEGKKTLAYEISEQLDWQVPDRILLPTAGGTNALALHQGYRELNELGWVAGLPALDIVQPENCAPIVRAWESGAPMEPWGQTDTILTGIDHPNPKAGDAIVDIMRETEARGWTVSDADALAAGRLLAATEGIFVQPASAAPLGCFIAMGPERTRREFGNQRIVLIATGSGKNQVVEPLAGVGKPPRIAATLEAFEAANG